MKYLKKHYLILVLVIISLTPVIWFVSHPGYLINGVDTNFPLDPIVWFLRRLYVWNSVTNAGVDFSSSTSGIFFHLIQVIPYLLHFSLPMVEMLSLIFWFSAIVIASFLFIHSLTKNKTSEIIFILFYTLNTYLFNTWENVKVSNIALMIGLPLFIGLFNYYQQKHIRLSKLILFSAIGVLLTAGSGINPAYFITMVGGLILYCSLELMSTVTKEERLKILSGLGIILATIIVFNLFWILPTLNYLIFGQNHIASLSDIGFVNWVDSLSKNTSLVNVMRIQGAWDWYEFDQIGNPQYLPYIVNFFNRIPFIIFSFLIPIMAIISLIVRSKKFKKQYAIMSVFALISIFLGSGTHEPTGIIYRWLSLHLPFFSFFRSPWYIFTPFLILAYAALIAFLYEATITNPRIPKLIVYLVTAVILSGNLLYNYPLLTGKVFRPARSDGFFVRFPEYVWQVKKYLDTRPTYPRMIGYPDDSIENYNWGYKGVEMITGLYSNKEYITTSAGLTQEIGRALGYFYDYLKKGQNQSAYAIMPFLGADAVFEKKDVFTLAPKIQDTTSEVHQFDKWEIHEPAIKNNNKLFVASSFYKSDAASQSDFPVLAKYLNTDGVIVNQDDSIFKIIENLDNTVKGTSSSFNVAENNTYHDNPSNGVMNYSFNILEDGYYTLYLQRLSVDDINRPKISIDNVLFSNSYLDDSAVILPSIKFTKGSHSARIEYNQPENGITITDYSSLTDIKNIRHEDLPINLKNTLVAFNDNKETKNIHIPVSMFNPFEKYELSFDYKYIYGKMPTVDIHQFSETTQLKVQSMSLKVSSDWTHFTAIFTPVPTTSKIDVFINILGDVYGGMSKSYIENISIKKVFDQKLFILEDGKNSNYQKAKLSIIRKSPVRYEINVENGEAGSVIAFLENYSQDWEMIRVGSTVKPLHFMVNDYANAWYVPESNIANYKLIVRYKPQRLFILGAIVFAIAWMFVILLNLRSVKLKRKDVTK